MNTSTTTRFTLALALTAAVVFSACSGPGEEVRQELIFLNHNQTDTADFIHILPEGQLFSIEILGSCENLDDSTYHYQLQVGTYESPGFVQREYIINPEKIVLTIDGVEPQSQGFTVVYPYPARPWVALSNHGFTFAKSTLQKLAAKGLPLRFNLHLDGYAEYGGKVVRLQDVPVLDRWFHVPHPTVLED